MDEGCTEFCVVYESPIGNLLMYGDSDYLLGLYMDTSKSLPNVDSLVIDLEDAPQVFKDTAAWLDRYFDGENVEPSELKFKMQGTTFQKKVWKLLCKIPYGETVSYGDLAAVVAKKMHKAKMSAQAIGGAVGKNPISIIVPCHRVVGAGGNLVGYGGGLERKMELLVLEHLYKRA